VVNGISVAFGAMMAAIFAGIGLYILVPFINLLGMGNASSGTTGGWAGNGSALGLWGLLPVLFPFIVIAGIVLAIYAMYRSYVAD
jgi:hypothetical protein